MLDTVRPRLDLRQRLGERRTGDFRVVIGLQAQPPAVRKTEEAAQPQIGVGRDPALARELG